MYAAAARAMAGGGRCCCWQIDEVPRQRCFYVQLNELDAADEERLLGSANCELRGACNVKMDASVYQQASRFTSVQVCCQSECVCEQRL
jgi:hypothetical protein